MEFDTAALPDLAAFAVANSLTYEPSAFVPDYGGALFEFLQRAGVTDRFVASDGLEVGRITGDVGGSQTRTSGSFTVTTTISTTTVRTYGYIAIRLNRNMPQLVLDAKRNGRSIPMPIARGQKLSLEGDFNRHFTLYAPNGYERDALYVMTPDLMGLLIDETGNFDVEIVDNYLFAYSPKDFDLHSAELWQRIARIRDVLGAKALSQTERYRDDAPGSTATTVAPDGARLRMMFNGGGPTSMIVILVIIGIAFVAVVGGVIAILAAAGDHVLP
jgi:hypothetical protein